jgi:UDP-sugar pyrophosphorylase
LGERLGYSGIKIGLPVCTLENKDYTYLKFYCNYVHAFRERAVAMMDQSKDHSKFYIPLCIMVSDDTHDRTIKILEENDYFGIGKDHIDIVKQENVPALLDNDGSIALDDKEFKIITKPHGHGDIHTLLYQN